jgi:cytoskeleton-associated protein 5
VRDAALTAMAAAFRTCGDLTYIHRLIDAMDPVRKKKLQSLAVEASSGDGAPPAAAAAAPQAAPKAAAAAPKAAAAKPATAALARNNSGGRPPKAASSARVSQEDDNADFNLDMGNPDDVAAAIESLVGAGVVERLSSTEWKERLEAATELTAAVTAAPHDVLSTHCEVIVRQLGIAPGWEERNMQVAAKCFEVLSFLAREVQDFTRQAAMLAMDAVVGKVADPKLKGAAADVLTAWAEALGPRFIAAQLYKRTAAHKNPKTAELALGWLTFALEEFGGRLFDVKFAMNAAKESVSHTNPGVKAAAVKLLGSIHCAFGPAVKNYLTDFKPALMPVLEAEFVRCPYNPAAMEGTRAVRASAGIPEAAGAPPGEKIGGLRQARQSVGGLPREDVTPLITPQLIKDLSNADWKARVCSPDPALVARCF